MPHIHSNEIPRRYVAGIGPAPCRIAFVGEGPGFAENAAGIPFIGQAGEEKNRYLRAAGLLRSEVFITNLARYWPLVDFRGKQLPPTPEDIKRDEPDLLLELGVVQPEIIGAVGAHAARYFLGSRFKNMRQCHGVPYRVNLQGREITVVALFHPASGLHDGSQETMARIQFDYQQIGKLSRGQIEAAEPVDEYPDAQYTRLFDADGGAAQLSSILAGATYLSIDTEGPAWDPECVTVCVQPGVAWFIDVAQTETLAALNAHINALHAICTVGCHYLAHDIPVLAAMNVHVDRHRALNLDGSPTLRCTMNDLHLLGGIEPMGLKAAEWRMCGMEAESYEEVTAEAEYAKARGYLARIWTAGQCGCCAGAGKIPALGKKGQTLKRLERCPMCVDGLTIPLPERELVFDADKAAFRWKQPQSIAKWIRKRLEKQSLLDEEDDDGEADNEAGTNAEAQIEDEGAEEEESVKAYFQLRKDWLSKAPADARAAAEALIGSAMPRTRLSDVADQQRVTRYACRDADAGLRITHPLDDRIDQLGLQNAQQIDAAMIPILSAMERNGMRIDRPHLEAFSADLSKEITDIRERLDDLVGEKNPNSKRMIGVLFRDLGLPPVKITATGQESTDDETLGTLRGQLLKRPDDELKRVGIAVIDCMTDYRERLTSKSTVDKILLHADREDRIHTTIKYTSSMTRLSSAEPINLQNIANPDNSPHGDDPIRNVGLRMRNGFIARDGYKLIDCDFSSIELVVGAHLTQDRNLMRIFREGLDPHRYAASELLGMRMEDVPKAVRTQCKTLNFAAFYDTSPMTLQRQFALMQPPIEKSIEECEDLIRWYFSEFAPDVQEWKERTRKQARIDGYVRTMFGRLRWMTGLRSDIKRVRSAAERECTNQPIQGTAGDILRIALAIMWERELPALWAEGIDAQPTMTMHDAITLEAPDEHAELVGWMMGEAMRTAVKLSVPVKVGVKMGDRWGSVA